MKNGKTGGKQESVRGLGNELLGKRLHIQRSKTIKKRSKKL